MLAPLSWIREFVPYEGTAEELGDKLTMLGLELEGINHPFAGLAGIKVGHIVQCVDHPDSDHLHCCKVDLGNGELADIVCGAPNVAEGQKVAVAPVGCRLPDGALIKKAKLRGQPSHGMICSERELGLSDDHSGILVLPESCVTGHNLLDALDMERDVLDISITPNRPDCLSILGIARETAMAYGLPFHVPELPLIPDRQKPGLELPVSIDNPELCWLYSGRALSNIQMGKAPMRMRYRLLSVSVRPVSNIVDITNYILFECGQPLHAFDLEALAQRRIIVRTARENECLVTLDGKRRELSPFDLCICDAEKPVGLAGVMGGLNSEITDSTVNVFLESAVFQPQTIRKTARRLGLNSEASYRFERGVDQARTIWALNRACAMMASIAGAIVSGYCSIAEPAPFIPARINFRPQRAKLLLGCDIEPAFQEKALREDGCAVERQSADNWLVIQPSWRPDLKREADLIEEVARIYGVDEIPCALPAVQKTLSDNIGKETIFDFLGRTRHWCAGQGLHEAVNYSFAARRELELLRSFSDVNIALANPLSEDHDVLRNILTPGLLWDLKNNLAHGAQSIRLFEIANVFKNDSKSETGADETVMLGILLSGPVHEKGWPRNDALLDYADLKGIVDNFMKFLHLPIPQTPRLAAHAFLNPCVEVIVKGKRMGVMGAAPPQLVKNWNAQKPVWLCELNLESLRQLAEESRMRFRSLPVYPSVKRDITVMGKAELQAGQILEKILAIKLPLLEGAELADCFLPPDKHERYLTFRLTFRHPGRTLKDEEVDREREKIAEILRRELSVRI